MKIFLTFFFDDELQQALEEIRNQVRKSIQSDYVQNSHRPHITLASYDIDNADALDSVLSKFCENTKEFPIEFRSLGIFPKASCLFAAPVVSFKMLSIHKDLLSAIQQETLYPHHLSAGKWMPHCELAAMIPNDQFSQIYSELERNWNNVSGFVKGIGLLVHPETLDKKQYAFSRDNISKK